MNPEKKEKAILLLSFFSGLAFAVAEFIFAIYSRSQSALTDAVYDASELVFIALLLFLTPLFHKPVSEKHPYGYFQLESIFVIVKGVMMLSVTLGVSAEVISAALTGGNPVDATQVALFQLGLGAASLLIYLIMARLDRSLSSPTITTELLGWKVDVLYSFGMSAAFFLSRLLAGTRLAFLTPYFDPLVAVLVMVFMLPESVKVLLGAVKDLFLFSPGQELVDQIKTTCTARLEPYRFTPVFFDITRTGRHLWVAIYFHIAGDTLAVRDLDQALQEVNQALNEAMPECTCELILLPHKDGVPT